MIKSSFAGIAATLLSGLWLLCSATQVLAHTTLISSVPADGQTVESLSQLELEFGAPMRLMALSLKDAANNSIALEFKRSVTAQARFVVPVIAPLPAATYQLSWMGMGEDGHRMEGTFSFVVDPDAASVTAPRRSGPAIPLFSGLDQPAAKAVQDFHRALKEGDTAAVTRLLATDLVVFEGGSVERTKAEYQSHHMAADMAFLNDMAIETIEHHVRVTGDSALSLARSTVSGQYKDRAINHTGMETITLQFRDGRWQITHIHWSK